jgi:hypothetical protein
MLMKSNESFGFLFSHYFPQVFFFSQTKFKNLIEGWGCSLVKRALTKHARDPGFVL